MDKLLKALLAAKPVVDTDTLLQSQDLYGDGILDSFDILTIIDELRAVFEIDISGIRRDDFVTVESIRELVRRCGGSL
jgi:acyl carrier protein